MSNYIVPRESFRNKVLVGTVLALISFPRAYSTLNDVLYPLCMAICQAVLIGCGMLPSSLESPLYAHKAAGPVSPYYVLLLKELALQEQVLELKLTSLLHFSWVTFLQILRATGVVHNTLYVFQKAVQVTASESYRLAITFYEVLQVLLLTWYMSRTIYSCTFEALWAAQPSSERAPKTRGHFGQSRFLDNKLIMTGMGVYFQPIKAVVTLFPSAVGDLCKTAMSIGLWLVWSALGMLGLQGKTRRFLGIDLKPYELSDINFRSRLYLVASLAPHLRRARYYNGARLHRAIRQALVGKEWPERSKFETCRTKMKTFKHGFEFLAWFLEWDLPKEVISQATEDSVLVASNLPKATSYDAACGIFHALDSLPYLYFDFPRVFNMLVTEGALSHPPIAHALIDHYTQYPSYFQFIKALDRKWWQISQLVEGRPARRANRNSFQEPSARTTTGPRSEVAERSPALEADNAPFKSSNRSLIFVQPLNFATFAFWHLTGEMSFISEDLVTHLGLLPILTGYTFELQTGGTDRIHIVEQIVKLDFQVPGVTGAFSHEFVVFKYPVAPITLGEDFFVKYNFGYDGGVRRMSDSTVIPIVSNVVLAKRAQTDPVLDYSADVGTCPSYGVLNRRRVM